MMWVKWFGGDMPVPVGTLVEVKLRFGKTKVSHAGSGYATRWDWGGPWDGFDDILAYRRVGETSTDISIFKAMLNPSRVEEVA